MSKYSSMNQELDYSIKKVNIDIDYHQMEQD